MTHQAGNTYSQGYKYLVKNDAPALYQEEKQWLTDRQTDEAMAVIKEQAEKKRALLLEPVVRCAAQPRRPWSPTMRSTRGSSDG